MHAAMWLVHDAQKPLQKFQLASNVVSDICRSLAAKFGHVLLTKYKKLWMGKPGLVFYSNFYRLMKCHIMIEDDRTLERTCYFFVS